MKRIKSITKYIVIILLLFTLTTLIGCSNDIKISYYNDVSTIFKGESITLSRAVDGKLVKYESTNEDIVKIDNYEVFGYSIGDALIYAKVGSKIVATYLVSVIENKVTSIELSNLSSIKKGDTFQLEVTFYPSKTSDDVIYNCSDEEIASVSKTGLITALKKGIVTVRCYLRNDLEIFDEITFVVTEELDENNSYKKTEEEVKEELDISDYHQQFVTQINRNLGSVVALNSYQRSYFNQTQKTSACATVYKRFLVLENGQRVLDDDIHNDQVFKTYEYYALTNKHLVNNKSLIEIVVEDKIVEATVIASDNKVNISVIKFQINKYIPTIKFSEETLKTGDFVISIGTNVELDKTVSFGISSYVDRYLADDTDSDGVKDWDAQYIQHDAPLGDEYCGGILMTLSGEVVGINTMRINSEKIENMSFAIPAEVILKLLCSLESGVPRVRATLGVSAVNVKDILKYQEYYPEVVIPDGVTYGIYVNEATYGQSAYKAGVKAGDIVMKIEDVDLYFTYDLRKVLDDYDEGCKEKVTLVINRNGTLLEIEVEL